MFYEFKFGKKVLLALHKACNFGINESGNISGNKSEKIYFFFTLPSELPLQKASASRGDTRLVAAEVACPA